MAQYGDSLGSFSGGLNRPPRGGDRFGPSMNGRRGVFPVKGKGHGQQGSAAFPDMLKQWDARAAWSSWRRGMDLAYNSLLRDRQQFLPARVLTLPAFESASTYRESNALLVAFPSKLSPDGRWTVTVKPRGTDISPQPVGAAVQKTVFSGDDSQLPPRLLEVDLSGVWSGGTLSAASALIGELVEDSGTGPTEVTDQEDDEVLILMCVAVYPERGVMAFDATRRWRRVLLPSGRRVLREEALDFRQNAPMFRSGRHLTQSTTLSCNCPAHLGLEYARLRHGEKIGGQGLFPQAGPQASSMRDAFEGMARRFFTLDWRRDPKQGCKHIHACRFALGLPVQEPDDYLSPAHEYWSSLTEMADLEELRAPLAHPKFVQELREKLALDWSYSEFDSTMTTGSVGDAFTVVPDVLELERAQVSSVNSANALTRFNQQQPLDYYQLGEQAVLGDVWTGRGSAVISKPYVGPGEVLDEPYVLVTAAQMGPVYG